MAFLTVAHVYVHRMMHSELTSKGQKYITLIFLLPAHMWHNFQQKVYIFLCAGGHVVLTLSGTHNMGQHTLKFKYLSSPVALQYVSAVGWHREITSAFGALPKPC